MTLPKYCKVFIYYYEWLCKLERRQKSLRCIERGKGLTEISSNIVSVSVLDLDTGLNPTCYLPFFGTPICATECVHHAAVLLHTRE